MIKAILTDIEGTTSSISFVHDVLFPYAYKEMENFLVQHFTDDFVQKQVLLIAEIEDLDSCQPDQIAEILRYWIKCDRKLTPLKELQGMIWEKGYKNGDYQAHLYEDAYQKLKLWHQNNIPIFVYSSGSVFAQKLFFSHSQYGNLINLFSDFFDTNIGNKKDGKSYQLIADKIGLPTSQILFLSDIQSEIDAAKSVNMQTIWIIRDKSLFEEKINLNLDYFIINNFSVIDKNELS